MAEALARGFIAAGKVQAGDVIASATSDPRKKVFRSFGANTADSNQQVLPQQDTHNPLHMRRADLHDLDLQL